MKVKFKKLDKLRKIVEIDVQGEELLNKRKEVYEKVGKNLKVPGFRKGKAPWELLEKHYGELLKEEFLKEALGEFYQKALKQENQDAVSLIKIYDVVLDKDSLRFSAEFEVAPHIDISDKDYKGIKLKYRRLEVKDEEIDKFITSHTEELKKITKKDDIQLYKWAGYSTEEELREAIRTELMYTTLGEIRQELERQVIDILLNRIKIDIPSTQVENQRERLFNREKHNLRMRGVSEDDIKKYEDDLKEKLTREAENNVKLVYILKAILKKEGIEDSTNLLDVGLGVVLNYAEFK